MSFLLTGPGAAGSQVWDRPLGDFLVPIRIHLEKCKCTAPVILKDTMVETHSGLSKVPRGTF